MSLLKRLFARPEDGTKIIDGAVNGLDKIFFTKEERADANNKLSEWYLKYLAATEGQNLARRMIAVIIVYVWTGLIAFGMFARAAELFLQRGVAQKLYPLSEFVLSLLVDVVMVPFGIVIGFYFLTHTVRAYKKES